MSELNKPIVITASNFEEVINKSYIVFVDFWAEWCAPCKQFAVVYDRVASIHTKRIVFGKIDIEKEHELDDSFHIRSIPHLMVFKQGIVIYSEAGNVPESVLNELIEQAIAADVSEIKNQADEQN